jgi:hypothetical protein
MLKSLKIKSLLIAKVLPFNCRCNSRTQVSFALMADTDPHKYKLDHKLDCLWSVPLAMIWSYSQNDFAQKG